MIQRIVDLDIRDLPRESMENFILTYLDLAENNRGIIRVIENDGLLSVIVDDSNREIV